MRTDLIPVAFPTHRPHHIAEKLICLPLIEDFPNIYKSNKEEVKFIFLKIESEKNIKSDMREDFSFYF